MIPSWLPWALLGAALVALLLRARRDATVYALEARGGRVVSTRGRAPAELVRELRDVLERGRATGSVALCLDRGRIAAVTRGLEPDVAQRVRNVVGRFPAHRIKTGR